jgi:protein TonB
MWGGWHGLKVAVCGSLWRMPPFACLLAASVLSGCSERRTEPPPSATTSPSVNAPAPSTIRPAPPAQPAPAVAPSSGGRTVEEYKQDVARWIYQSSAGDLFDGAPPAMLKSVVVLEIAVDANGLVRRAGVRRSNGYNELGGVLEFNETWLFRDDGRFQIRSIALPQAPPA